ATRSKLADCLRYCELPHALCASWPEAIERLPGVLNQPPDVWRRAGEKALADLDRHWLRIRAELAGESTERGELRGAARLTLRQAWDEPDLYAPIFREQAARVPDLLREIADARRQANT